MFLGHLSYLQLPNIKGSHVNFCNTVVKVHNKAKISTFFKLKWLIYVENFSPFSLYASNNLVHILLQLETFHAHYTMHKNQEDVLLVLHKVYKETTGHITEDQC